MSKHTPGPWTYDQGQYADWGCVKDASGFLVAKSVVPYGTDQNACRRERIDPCEANARLIAAAPDLLEALETLESMPDERSIHDISNEELAAWEKARAAIAKAKGLAHE